MAFDRTGFMRGVSQLATPQLISEMKRAANELQSINRGAKTGDKATLLDQLGIFMGIARSRAQRVGDPDRRNLTMAANYADQIVKATSKMTTATGRFFGGLAPTAGKTPARGGRQAPPGAQGAAQQTAGAQTAGVSARAEASAGRALMQLKAIMAKQSGRNAAYWKGLQTKISALEKVNQATLSPALQQDITATIAAAKELIASQQMTAQTAASNGAAQQSAAAAEVGAEAATGIAEQAAAQAAGTDAGATPGGAAAAGAATTTGTTPPTPDSPQPEGLLDKALDWLWPEDDPIYARPGLWLAVIAVGTGYYLTAKGE